MPYQIIIKTSARKELRKLPKATINALKKSISKLANEPRPSDAKKLSGTTKPLYRIRVGNFRVVYEIQDKQLFVFIIKVAHRKDIYKSLLH